MDLNEFLAVIEATPLLTAEEKTHYRTNAASFSQEYRTEIVAILRKHEKKFLEAVKAKDVTRAEETRSAAQVFMKEAQQREEKERIAEARQMQSELSEKMAYL